MTKIKRVFAIILAVMLIAFISAGGALGAFADVADDVPEISQETVAPDISSDYNGSEELSEKFIGYLKDKYGEDYVYYYNLIIEKWGSVEAYLLSLGEKLPADYKSGWDTFVGWLGEYSVIWAPVFALAIVIIVAVVGKKQFNKIFDKAVAKKLEPVINELNLQSNATVTLMRAQRAFFGNNKTLLDNNAGLSEAVKELESAEEDLKK